VGGASGSGGAGGGGPPGNEAAVGSTVVTRKLGGAAGVGGGALGTAASAGAAVTGGAPPGNEAVPRGRPGETASLGSSADVFRRNLRALGAAGVRAIVEPHDPDGALFAYALAGESARSRLERYFGDFRQVGLEISGVRAYDVWTRDRDQLGVDIDLRFIKTQCRVSQGNLDREVMSQIGYLKAELVRCGDTI